jgi:PadR family transcriptional regulator PadR
MSREVLQGTLDLMVLRTLDTMGPQHGLGLAKRILQVSESLLDLNQGTLYPALLRLEQRRWIKSRWGVSDNNRKAKFYELTARGRRQIREETENWELTVTLMAKFLAKPAGDRHVEAQRSRPRGACIARDGREFAQRRMRWRRIHVERVHIMRCDGPNITQ